MSHENLTFVGNDVVSGGRGDEPLVELDFHCAKLTMTEPEEEAKDGDLEHNLHFDRLNFDFWRQLCRMTFWWLSE